MHPHVTSKELSERLKATITTKPNGHVVIEYDNMLVAGYTLEEAIAELADAFYQRAVNSRFE